MTPDEREELLFLYAAGALEGDERDELEDWLARAGDTGRATLAGVSARSAPGSTLIVNYHTAHRRFLVRLMFRLIGEPQISAWTPDEMAGDLRSAGFEVREDSGMADWNQRFVQGRAKVDRGAYMRVVVARKGPVR